MANTIDVAVKGNSTCMWLSLSFKLLLDFVCWSCFLFSLGLGFLFSCLLIGCTYVVSSEKSDFPNVFVGYLISVKNLLRKERDLTPAA